MDHPQPSQIPLPKTTKTPTTHRAEQIRQQARFAYLSTAPLPSNPGPQDLPIQGYHRPQVPIHTKPSSQNSTALPPLTGGAPSSREEKDLPTQEQHVSYDMECHPANDSEEEEDQVAEIELSESEWPLGLDSHIPLGQLKAAKQAVEHPPPARREPMHLVLEGRRNNLTPIEVAKMTEMSKERGGQGRFDFTSPKARTIYRCPLPCAEGHRDPTAPNQRCNMPVNPNGIARTLKRHIEYHHAQIGCDIHVRVERFNKKSQNFIFPCPTKAPQQRRGPHGQGSQQKSQETEDNDPLHPPPSTADNNKASPNPNPHPDIRGEKRMRPLDSTTTLPTKATSPYPEWVTRMRSAPGGTQDKSKATNIHPTPQYSPPHKPDPPPKRHHTETLNRPARDECPSDTNDIPEAQSSEGEQDLLGELESQWSYSSKHKTKEHDSHRPGQSLTRQHSTTASHGTSKNDTVKARPPVSLLPPPDSEPGELQSHNPTLTRFLAAYLSQPNPSQENVRLETAFGHPKASKQPNPGGDTTQIRPVQPLRPTTKKGSARILHRHPSHCSSPTGQKPMQTVHQSLDEDHEEPHSDHPLPPRPPSEAYHNSLLQMNFGDKPGGPSEEGNVEDNEPFAEDPSMSSAGNK